MSAEDFEFEVGDELDLPPILGSRYISALLAVGGEFYIDGNAIIVTGLPQAYIDRKNKNKPEHQPEAEKTVEENIRDAVDSVDAANEQIGGSATAPAEAISVEAAGEFEEVLDTIKEEAAEDVAAENAAASEKEAAKPPVKRGRKPAASKSPVTEE